MTRLRRRLANESGQGLITGVILLAGVMLPVMFIAPLFGRIESAHLAAQQAAHDAVRSAVQAPDGGQAQTAAQSALDRARTQSGEPLRLSLSGRFARGSVLTARVSANIPLGTLPLLGSFGTVSVRGQASAPVDRYRSLLQAQGP